MKERQRWQPEEDALLRAYVKQYGAKDWNLISQRMGNGSNGNNPLHRDPKSCLERWKNYLKPGLKKGSLTPDEQSLVISLQAKYGNKWKKIAAEVPGRTPKRLGKWWEVFKEKQLKQLQKQNNKTHHTTSSDGNIPVAGVASPDTAVHGPYDHILETFAEKYVQPKLHQFGSPIPLPHTMRTAIPGSEPDPVLSLGSVGSAASSSVLPPWMNMNMNMSMNPSSSTTSSATSSTTHSPSVSLSLSPSDPGIEPDPTRFLPVQQVGTLLQCCRELEEGRQSWVQHKKEATWRLSRLEQQLESEKARKRREAMEEIEAKIRCLREEETAFLGRIESEYRDQLVVLHREADNKEAKLVEAWCSKQTKLAKLVEQITTHACNHG